MRVSSTTKQQAGDYAEQSACEFLEKNNLRLVQRNYLCRVGEIDLIMRDQETMVFVEVRYRTNPEFGTALESVTYQKQQRLIRAAQHYLQTHGLAEKIPCRFDVVALQSHRIEPIAMEWVKNAFEG
jgi:putative endonuclease